MNTDKKQYRLIVNFSDIKEGLVFTQDMLDGEIIYRYDNNGKRGWNKKWFVEDTGYFELVEPSKQPPIGSKDWEYKVKVGDTFNGNKVDYVGMEGTAVVIKTKPTEEKKDVLFTTEDGKPAFLSTWIYGVLENYAITEFIWHEMENFDPKISIQKHIKYFSTKEAAEQYILYHKPCLSLDDIAVGIEPSLFDAITLIAKQRLKL